MRDIKKVLKAAKETNTCIDAFNEMIDQAIRVGAQESVDELRKGKAAIIDRFVQNEILASDATHSFWACFLKLFGKKRMHFKG